MPEVAMGAAVELPDFDHVDLNQIDPNFAKIPGGFYNLQFVKVEKKPYKVGEVYKSGPNAGQVRPDAGETKEFLKLQIQIVDDESFSGRRVFESGFEGWDFYRGMRRVMDAVGIPKDPDTSLFEYVEQLIGEAATFNGRIYPVEGDAFRENALDWKSIQPAAN